MPVRLTKAVKILLGSCLAIYLITWALDFWHEGAVIHWLALNPVDFIQHRALWQLFTYSFVHTDVMHLFLNMMMLAFIGSDLESAWGIPRFLKYYFFCTTWAGLLYVILQAFFWGPEAGAGMMAGASGGIYGLLMAYGLIFGERVMLFMMLFPMKAKHFIWILAAIEFMSSTAHHGGNLASAAHLGGMAAGFGYLWIWASLSMMRKRKAAEGPLKKKAKRKNAPHLTLIKNTGRDSESDDDADNPKTWH